MSMYTVVDELGDGFTVVADFVYKADWLSGGGVDSVPRLVKLRIEAPLNNDREIGSADMRGISMVRLRQLANDGITEYLRDPVALRQALMHDGLAHWAEAPPGIPEVQEANARRLGEDI